jgi:hypothetical protein
MQMFEVTTYNRRDPHAHDLLHVYRLAVPVHPCLPVSPPPPHPLTGLVTWMTHWALMMSTALVS